jgi:hypothetical protein
MEQVKRATIPRATIERASLLHAPGTVNSRKEKERTPWGQRSEAAIYLLQVLPHTLPESVRSSRASKKPKLLTQQNFSNSFLEITQDLLNSL